jgi:hypothetical protein
LLGLLCNAPTVSGAMRSSNSSTFSMTWSFMFSLVLWFTNE